MKLLRGEVQEVVRDGIRIAVKVIDGVEQGKVSSLMIKTNAEDIVYRITYCIRNLLSPISGKDDGKEYVLEVDGEFFTVDDLTYINGGVLKCRVDNSNEKTRTTFLTVGEMINEVIFVGDEEGKKSELLPQRKKSAKVAKYAR